MNGEYLKKIDDEEFYEMALPYIKKAITKDLDLKKIATLVKTRIETFLDIEEMVDFFEELPDYDIEIYTHKRMKTNPENSLEILIDLLAILEENDDYSEAGLEKVIKGYIAEKDIKGGRVFWPIRIAVSCKESTPGGAYEIMSILGKDESLRRIRIAIDKIRG